MRNRFGIGVQRACDVAGSSSKARAACARISVKFDRRSAARLRELGSAATMLREDRRDALAVGADPLLDHLRDLSALSGPQRTRQGRVGDVANERMLEAELAGRRPPSSSSKARRDPL